MTVTEKQRVHFKTPNTKFISKLLLLMESQHIGHRSSDLYIKGTWACGRQEATSLRRSNCDILVTTIYISQVALACPLSASLREDERLGDNSGLAVNWLGVLIATSCRALLHAPGIIYQTTGVCSSADIIDGKSICRFSLDIWTEVGITESIQLFIYLYRLSDNFTTDST